MVNGNKLKALLLAGIMVMSFAAAAGCGEDESEPEEAVSSNSTSVQPSAVQSASKPTIPAQPSAASKSVQTSSASSRVQSSKAESSKKEEVSKLSKEVQEKVLNIIAESTSEREMYEAIYALKDFKADGHVITDLDGDGNYELVTRTKDRKTIKIYRVVNGQLKGPLQLKAPMQADLRYGYYCDDKKYCDDSCYLTTLEDRGNDTYAMTVYLYSGIEEELVPDTELIFARENAWDPDSNVYVANGMEFIEQSWQESFNDKCLYVVDPAEDTLELSKKRMEELIDTFAGSYYKKKDFRLLTTHNPVAEGTSLPINSISDLAKNEVLARHGQAFTHPLCIAFFNKNAHYNPVMSVGYYTVENTINNGEEFTNADRRILMAFTNYDNNVNKYSFPGLDNDDDQPEDQSESQDENQDESQDENQDDYQGDYQGEDQYYNDEEVNYYEYYE